MKPAGIFKIFLIVFSVFFSDCIYSQCTPVYTSHTVSITNNTNCDFLVSWEAGERGICEACAGAAETVTSGATISSTGYNCHAPSCTSQVIDVIIWAIAEPVLTGSCVVTSDAQVFGCSGASPISGTGPIVV